MICPNCFKECECLYSHDGDCDCCEGELDVVHCGCYHDDNGDAIYKASESGARGESME